MPGQLALFRWECGTCGDEPPWCPRYWDWKFIPWFG
jgi:hypothetical protein